jgi:hypothetical protein
MFSDPQMGSTPRCLTPSRSIYPRSIKPFIPPRVKRGEGAQVSVFDT